MKIRQAATLVGTAALLLAAAPTAAQATTSAAGCSINLGAVTASGIHTFRTVTSTTPPASSAVVNTAGVFGAGKVRLSTSFIDTPASQGTPDGSSRRYGYAVLEETLMRVDYTTKPDGTLDEYTMSPLAEGFTGYTAIELSQYVDDNTGFSRHTFYALRADGTLERRDLDKGWAVNGTYAGLRGIKAIALIGQTATYDTFLANTTAGGLYTVHIPVSSPMKPVLKTVRTSTWQGFETLIAGRCGADGTVLVGIDKDSRTGQVYELGHANGTATAIRSKGALPGGAADPINFRWAPELGYLPGE
ncbi:hypothetical protein ACI2LF_06895 [Kribbella sp. NPDC020789]